MGKGDHLGEFEHLVMLALLRLRDSAYGMRVRREIQSRTERSVAIGSVYAALDRLERKGYVRSAIRAPDPVPGGRQGMNAADKKCAGHRSEKIPCPRGQHTTPSHHVLC